MSPISTNDAGRIVISKPMAFVLSLAIALVTTAFSAGVKWTNSENALAQEKRERISADSSIVRQLEPIAKDVRAIKAKVLHCENDALCQQ